MKESQSDRLPEEKRKVLDRLRENLRQEVLSGIENLGLRESMINEYKEIAGNAGRLLGMLQKYDFVDKLLPADLAEYDRLMQNLSMSGIRCHILVEESRSVDNDTLLAMSPSPSTQLH